MRYWFLAVDSGARPQGILPEQIRTAIVDGEAIEILRFRCDEIERLSLTPSRICGTLEDEDSGVAWSYEWSCDWSEAWTAGVWFEIDWIWLDRWCEATESYISKDS